MDTFWQTIQKPIIGLSPMDGITDPAFRAIVDEIGHPTVLYTEFVSADGLVRNQKLLRTFTSHQTTTPLVGQLFGHDPVSMSEAASILIEQTQIVGIDINMGCPARRVAQHGGGAALIKNPNLAQQLVESVKKAIVKSKKSIGLSVKTRIGYDSAITAQWIPILLETHLDAIAVHGRTLKQQYSGHADWNEIKKAAALANDAHTILLGNGDIENREDAHKKANEYSPDGVLIGRATLGNPWVFTKHQPTQNDRITVAIQHCTYFKKYTPTANPLSLRKHLAWYMKGFEHATEIRKTLVEITTVQEAIEILERVRSSA